MTNKIQVETEINTNELFIDRTSDANNSIDMSNTVPVKGYQGLYEIDLAGNVTSFKRKKPKILKACYDRKGYQYLKLWKNGLKKTFKVHNLQMLSRNSNFKDNISNGLEIDHWDGIRDNNNINNLSMISGEENRKRSSQFVTNSTFSNVYWNQTLNEFTGQFQYNKVFYKLGPFDTEIEAYHSIIAKKEELKGNHI